MKKGQEWSQKQIDYLYKHYPVKRAEDIAKEIGKSVSSVHHKASRLNISKDAEGFHGIRHNACVGENSGNFKGYRRKTPKGYIVRFVPEHPFASKSGLVMEHRLVVEEKLGFYLPKNFVVHHINGVKDDNRIENLAIMTISAHNAYHNRKDGKQRKGKNHPRYKEVDIKKINRLIENGYSVSEACKMENVSKSNYYKKRGA